MKYLTFLDGFFDFDFSKFASKSYSGTGLGILLQKLS